MSELKFESATLADFDQLLPLVNAFDQSLSVEKKLAYDRRKEETRNKRYLRKYLADNSCCYLLYRYNDLIIAYCFLSIEKTKRRTTGYINELFVEQNQRGNSIGSALLHASLAWLKERQCNSINLTVNENNTVAIHLYQKAGFVANHYINMSLEDHV